MMRSLVIPLVVLSASVLALLAYVALHSRHKKSSREPLRLVGRVASVEKELRPEGFILVDGELWPARARAGQSIVPVGASVRVVGARGHLLEVEPLG
ncbi:MAG: NfeD family protein [Rubrivivax sp.]|nr:NfeD family protein [Pyrinomonadaceae bacterium]